MLVKKIFYTLSKKMAYRKHFHFHSIGVVLKKYRKLSKMTQAKLAQKLGVGDNYISKIERGKEHPSVEMLVKFSLHMKVRPGELLDTIVEQEMESGNKDFPWITLYNEID